MLPLNANPIITALDGRAQKAQAIRSTVSTTLNDSGVAEAYDQLVKADFPANARPMKPEEVRAFTEKANSQASTLKAFDQVKSMDFDDRPGAVAVSYNGLVVCDQVAGRSDEFLTRYSNPNVPEYSVNAVTLGDQIEGIEVVGNGEKANVKGTRYWIDPQSATGVILEFGGQG